MHDSETADPVSPALLDLLAVFEGPLAEVQFPGVDQGVLRGLVDQVRGHAHELDQLRAQLDALHNQLTEARLRLLRTAEQGLAYARVFAADDPELDARLADIHLGGGKTEPRRRKLEVASADSGNTEPLRLPPRRGRKPRVAEEAPTGS
ncbi:hypothetical protein [Nannocystis radixulma]|uniref:Uncharacterized protein n=1 Tax=Nannocystis radixulma TaxID=2995305 RepID=A0ABT5B4S0_9BACT|nr:hypothetical protein [Nannocystis radixulma]MDC0669086.1 hypothetical protein [Nannocystis radixulma]MDC0673159.1 hypothetical protein [Nannocystis radixulma]